ncbi:hypothetical protein IFM89_013032 [Coptis chinensis]|uniref:Uncharacterized protein n=1 Tax=Coptis chinensis TaxID=261450 RepID=A0A835H0K5_9MAGN|nr:hypothetical protein IFM89_013032 [Coptis chinensis]
MTRSSQLSIDPVLVVTISQDLCNNISAVIYLLTGLTTANVVLILIHLGAPLRYSPNRAFGDLIAAAGITDAMLDSLIALKDLEGVEGLSPLSEIEDTNSEKSQKSCTRAEIERRKQEEIDKSRVRRVDEKGRAYGT